MTRCTFVVIYVCALYFDVSYLWSNCVITDDAWWWWWWWWWLTCGTDVAVVVAAAAGLSVGLLAWNLLSRRCCHRCVLLETSFSSVVRSSSSSASLAFRFNSHLYSSIKIDSIVKTRKHTQESCTKSRTQPTTVTMHISLNNNYCDWEVERIGLSSQHEEKEPVIEALEVFGCEVWITKMRLWDF